MKSKIISIVFIGVLIIGSAFGIIASYDSSFVIISTAKHDGYRYKVIYMERGESGKRIKAKYFAANDPYSGRTVPNRYSKWASNKNVICVTSGTYMDSYTNPKPVGLTVDNGVIVNRNLRSDMDGLVIVYATGGVVATNLKDKDLKVQGGEIAGIKLDLQGNAFHKSKFLSWCEQNEATVFQTHLLVYKNKLKISSYNSSDVERERRFLAVGTDENGNVVHSIIHSPQYTTLYEGAKRVLDFLNSVKDLNVIFMVNLDTGAQDVFTVYNSDGSIRSDMKGQLSVSQAINLLVYYYE